MKIRGEMRGWHEGGASIVGKLNSGFLFGSNPPHLHAGQWGWHFLVTCHTQLPLPALEASAVSRGC